MIPSKPAMPARVRPVRRAALAAAALAVWMPLMPGCAGDPDAPGLVDRFLPPPPEASARDAFNMYDADARRRGVARLASESFGGEAPYVRVYRLLLDDADPTVRAAAVKALGMHGTSQDGASIAGLLARDDAAIVRWEAAKALQRIHSPEAVEALVAASGSDEDADVRMAAARALGQYPRRSVFDALVGALGDTDFGVVEAARSSLVTLTGHDAGIDGAAWLAWADGRGEGLFAQGTRYTYRPYAKPRGLLGKALFWREPPEAEPKRPVGIETEPESPDAASS